MTVRAGINRGRKWIVGSGVHGCWLGHYESDKQDVVRRIVQPGMNVIDLGAHAGFYTLAFSGLVENRGHVWAFEPFAVNAANLHRHFRLNSIANVTLVQVAVSDASGIAGFNVASNTSMGSLGDGAGSPYLVPCASLDDLLGSGLIAVPDVVKMDVEGAESRVLCGARQLLSRKKTVWLISLHGREQKRLCAQLLREAGYLIFQLDGAPAEAGEECADEIVARPAVGSI